ncbi:hypothetical protein KPH14_008498 [Odynerus spinipes]|uniref:Uncharacterized protein n=1 Tax=Odynerus spinipes TaxID=1348599 RepID=A0AAD9RG84_9HYME|nr:hypothetical protein KPH14_008498 [Odynerus spinipes]
MKRKEKKRTSSAEEDKENSRLQQNIRQLEKKLDRKKEDSRKACRESYGDEAIGYVQLKREKSICTVKCRICSEHKVRSKAYSVTLILDEIEEKILDINCHDCAAATGGCKYAVALLMWVHRRSEDPAPTDIACY